MPADTNPVVEVMSGPQTPAALVDRVADAVEASGKDALRLYRPTIGYVVNRLQYAILHGAHYRIEAGVTSAAEIDRAAHSCRWTQPQSRHPDVAGAARNDAHRRRQRHGPSRHDARCAPRHEKARVAGVAWVGTRRRHPRTGCTSPTPRCGRHSWWSARRRAAAPDVPPTLDPAGSHEASLISTRWKRPPEQPVGRAPEFYPRLADPSQPRVASDTEGCQADTGTALSLQTVLVARDLFRGSLKQLRSSPWVHQVAADREGVRYQDGGGCCEAEKTERVLAMGASA